MFVFNPLCLIKLDIVVANLQSDFWKFVFVFSAQEPKHRCLMEDDLEVGHNKN